MSQKNQDQNNPSLLEFPCEFPIKAMGKSSGDFEQLVTGIVLSHAKLWSDNSVRTASSNEGNYLSVTVVVKATSQEQLDAIYQDLTDCPEVLMAL
jgi:putative lipoic acid-binding regulatory protein